MSLSRHCWHHSKLQPHNSIKNSPRSFVVDIRVNLYAGKGAVVLRRTAWLGSGTGKLDGISERCEDATSGVRLQNGAAGDCGRHIRRILLSTLDVVLRVLLVVALGLVRIRSVRTATSGSRLARWLVLFETVVERSLILTLTLNFS